MAGIKVLSEKQVFKADLFNVKEVEIEFEGPKDKTVHFNVERKQVSCVFPLTDSYEIFLIQEYRYLYKKYLLTAVAGFVNEGETTLNAARRELKEEAGISAGHWEELTRFDLAASVVKATDHLFLAKDLEIGEQELEKDEEIKVVKMPLAEAVNKVLNGEIRISATIIGILLLDKLRKEKKI